MSTNNKTKIDLTESLIIEGLVKLIEQALSTKVDFAKCLQEANRLVILRKSNKTSDMESFLEKFVQQEFGKSRQTGSCVTCDNSNILSRSDFKDEPSWKEFSISRMCQKCQDSVFEIPENGEPTGKCANCGDLCYNGGTCCSEKCEKEYIAYVESEAF